LIENEEMRKNKMKTNLVESIKLKVESFLGESRKGKVKRGKLKGKSFVVGSKRISGIF
jgi:hypothetical protein